jgi:hypothetical protein
MLIILGAGPHYIIFEHLGGNTEEQQWANYKLLNQVKEL